MKGSRRQNKKNKGLDNIFKQAVKLSPEDGIKPIMPLDSKKQNENKQLFPEVKKNVENIKLEDPIYDKCQSNYPVDQPTVQRIISSRKKSAPKEKNLNKKIAIKRNKKKITIKDLLT